MARVIEQSERKADVTGVFSLPQVQIGQDDKSRFSFAVLTDENLHRVLNLDLSREAAAAIVPFLCAAFQTG